MDAESIRLAIEIIATLIGTLVSITFVRMSKDISRVCDSVEELNIKIAVVVERIDGHERRIGNLEKP